jgi:hypothetical protein
MFHPYVEAELHSFLTSALEKLSDQIHVPAALSPWKKGPLNTMLVGPQSRSRRLGEGSCLLPPTVIEHGSIEFYAWA